MTPHDMITKAKAGLILDQPFFASILLSMQITEDTSIKTMDTNGVDSIRYNPEFVKSMQLHEVTFVLAHETLHAVFQHCLTIGSKTPNRWNQACDYVINQILTDDRVGVMPKCGILNPDLVKRGGGTSDGVYKLLPEDSEDKGTGDNGGAMDSLHDDSKDDADRTAKSAEMKVKVLQAKNAAKMVGKLSAGLDRLIKDVTRSDTPWREVLRRFLSERCKVDLSYARPKRRFLADDINLPSLTGERMGLVAIGVDCSGSITKETLEAFSKEIRGIVQDVSPSQVKVFYFDTEVLRVDTFEMGDDVTLKPIGGGGTAFSPCLEAISALESMPMACIILTDLCCNDFGVVPEYPVLWASTERNGKAPFGDVLYIKCND